MTSIHVDAQHGNIIACEQLVLDVSRSLAVKGELSERRIPRIVAQDRVASIVLDGEVSRSAGVALGAGAVLYPESLVEARRPATYTAQGKVRAFRLRSDDFREVCDADARLAAAAYRALARCLAS